MLMVNPRPENLATLKAAPELDIMVSVGRHCS